jgi:hypothetical protein
MVRGLVASLALAGILVPASTALAADAGGIGIRLVGTPTASPADPRARSYIIDRPAPGTTLQRRVEISNTTGSAVDVAVYPAGAALRRGAFGFSSGRARNELSSWTTVDRQRLHLRPGTSAFETVTIAVPKDASIGQRYAVVWAETSNRAPAVGGVTLVNRVGVRIYLSIGPGGAPRSNFDVGSLVAKRSAAGVPFIVARIHNSGGRILNVSGYLTLSKGPGGLRAGPFPVEVAAGLGPGYTEPATVRLDRRLPRGPWRAHLRLRSGFVERAAAATIVFPRAGEVVRPAKPAERVTPVLLVGAMFVVLLALVALAFVLFRSRRLLSAG